MLVRRLQHVGRVNAEQQSCDLTADRELVPLYCKKHVDLVPLHEPTTGWENLTCALHCKRQTTFSREVYIKHGHYITLHPPCGILELHNVRRERE